MPRERNATAMEPLLKGAGPDQRSGRYDSDSSLSESGSGFNTSSGLRRLHPEVALQHDRKQVSNLTERIIGVSKKLVCLASVNILFLLVVAAGIAFFLMLFIQNGNSFCFLTGTNSAQDNVVMRGTDSTKKTATTKRLNSLKAISYITKAHRTSTEKIRKTCMIEGVYGGRFICNGKEFGEADPGSMCRVDCHSGFQIVGTPFRECLNNGEWSQSRSECVRECPPEAIPVDLIEKCSDGNLPGCQCTLQCKNGKQLQGSASRTCESDGSWSGPYPTCD